MNKQNDEKWLDELICHIINTEKPHFDTEKWKEKYPDEYKALLSRSAKEAPSCRLGIWRMIFRYPIAKLAAAAAIIIAVSFFAAYQDSTEKTDSFKMPQSPAQMMTAMSLKIAYRKGGIEAMEEQYNEAFKLLGPRQRSLSAEQIFAESNGI